MTAEFRIATLGGHLCSILVESSWTVQQAKEAIEAKSGIPTREQRLLSGVRELREGEVLCALLSSGAAAELVLVRRTPDQAEWLASVQEDGEALSGAPLWIREDLEVVTAAVSGNGYALEFAAPELQANWDVVLRALETDGCALEFAAEHLRADQDLVLLAVEQDGSALQFAAPHLREDRAVVLTAVRENGRALRFAGPRRRADRGVVWAAVQQNPCALEFAAEEVRADRQVILKAARNDATTTRFASRELESDEVAAVAASQEERRQHEMHRLAAENLQAGMMPGEDGLPARSSASVPDKAISGLAEMGVDQRLAIAVHWFMQAGHLNHRWAGIQLPLPPACSDCIFGRHLWCLRCGPSTMPQALRAMKRTAAEDPQTVQKEQRLMKDFLGSGLYFTGSDLQACAFKGHPR